MPKSVVLSTEDLNQYGTWLVTLGGRLENFRKNPVMFYDHKTYQKPIGHWENIRLENMRVVADPVFDEQDPEAADIKRKWENGDIRGGSLGVDIITLSSDPKYIKPGQRRETVLEWEAYEGSLTPLPNNANCLTLRRGELQLSSGENVDALNLVLPEIKQTLKMEKIALKLGLAKEATEDSILQKVDQLLQAEKSHLALKKFIDEQADGLDPEAKELYQSLSQTDPESAIKVLKLSRKIKSEEEPEGPDEEAAKEKAVSVSETLRVTMKRAKQSEKKETDKETFDYLQRNDPAKLMNLKRSDPAGYQKLVDEHLAAKSRKSKE